MNFKQLFLAVLMIISATSFTMNTYADDTPISYLPAGNILTLFNFNSTVTPFSGGCNYADNTCDKSSCRRASLTPFAFDDGAVQKNGVLFKIQETNMVPGGELTYVISKNQVENILTNGKLDPSKFIQNITVTCPDYTGDTATGTETVTTSIPVYDCNKHSFTINMSYETEHAYINPISCTFQGKACKAGDTFTITDGSTPTFECNWQGTNNQPSSN